MLSRDPLGRLGGSDNLYEYVRNNPVRGVDPEGTAAWVTVNRNPNFPWSYDHAFIEFKFPCMGAKKYGFYPSNFGVVSKGQIHVGDSNGKGVVELRNDDPMFERALCEHIKRAKLNPHWYSPLRYVCGSWVSDMWGQAQEDAYAQGGWLDWLMDQEWREMP